MSCSKKQHWATCGTLTLDLKVASQVRYGLFVLMPCLFRPFWQVVFEICFCFFDLILYVPSTIFQLNRGGSSWVEPVLS